jgi:hypothetical protein
VELGVRAQPFGMKVLSATHGWIIRECLVEYVPAGFPTVALTGEVTGRVATWRSTVSAIGTRYDLDCPRFCTRVCRQDDDAQYRPDTANVSDEDG